MKVQDDDKNLNEKQKLTMTTTKTSHWVWATIAFFAVLTYVTMPDPLQPPHGQSPSIQHVFYYGWLTAIFTGLGAVPLAFAPNLASYWVGLSNGTLRRPTECLQCLLCLVSVLFGLRRIVR